MVKRVKYEDMSNGQKLISLAEVLWDAKDRCNTNMLLADTWVSQTLGEVGLKLFQLAATINMDEILAEKFPVKSKRVRAP